jgi:hypothetical protein
MSWHKKLVKSTNTFLNSCSYWVTRTVRLLRDEYAAGEKLSSLLILVIDTLFTGVLIWYVIEHRNFVSYGIAAALITYWFTFAVNTISGRIKEQ